MVKKKMMEWAITTIVAYVREHGIEHVEQLSDWLMSLINGDGPVLSATSELKETFDTLLVEYDQLTKDVS
jgi:hypothetical protein